MIHPTRVDLPLYENRPECGVRELMQNSIDAVLEQEMYQSRVHDTPTPSFPDMTEDISIRAIKHQGSWTLKVTDQGIGMTVDIIKKSFLRAGVSYRDFNQWKDDFVDHDGNATVIKTGKFGIGAFAAFLLGSIIKVTTRHITSSNGLEFTFGLNTTEIEITKVDTAHHGTTIEIPLSDYAIEQLELEAHPENTRSGWDWFTLDHPKVKRFIENEGTSTDLPQEHNLPRSFPHAAGSWRSLEQDEYDGLCWSIVQERQATICNGIKIGKPVLEQVNQESKKKGEINGDRFDVKPPHDELIPPSNFSATDSNGKFPITLQRNATEGHLPDTLTKILHQDMAIDFIAFCLACAPENKFSADLRDAKYFEWYPFMATKGWFFHDDYTKLMENRAEHLVWCSNDSEVMPFSPSIVAPESITSILFQGSATQSLIRTMQPKLINLSYPDSLYCHIKDHTDQSDFLFPNKVICHFPFATKLMTTIQSGVIDKWGKVTQSFFLLVGNIAEWKKMLAKTSTTCDKFDIVEEHHLYILFKFGDAQIDDQINQQITHLKSLPKSLVGRIPSSIHIKVKLADQASRKEPEGVLETAWRKFIGTQGMPFDKKDRDQLINNVISKDDRLKAYYNTWKEYEPTYREFVRRR